MRESSLEVFNKSLIGKALPIRFILEYRLWASVLLAGDWKTYRTDQIYTGEHKHIHSPTPSPDSGSLRASINLMTVSSHPLMPKNQQRFNVSMYTYIYYAIYVYAFVVLVL